MLLKDINPFVRQVLIGGVGNNETSYSNDIFISLKTTDCRLFYITGGTGEIIIEDISFPIRSGCVILFQSGTKYIWNTTKVTFIVVNFDYTHNFSHIVTPSHPIKEELYGPSFRFENIQFSDATILNKPLYLKDAYFAEFFLQSMASQYYLDEAFISETLSSYMKATIVSIVRQHYSQSASIDNRGDRSIQHIIQYIQNNYSKDITNDGLADMFHFNPSYINRVFKKHTGMTIHKFLVNYRINVAKEILRTQNDSISKIAMDTGFMDIPHFVKSFKKHTNQTPSEYRNSFK